MAIKTATITVYEIFGTTGSFAADVFYHGKMIFTTESRNIHACAATAKAWAVVRNFNRFKITMN